jgi:hypothetical protein
MLMARRYAASQALGASFKLFISFDMSVLPCAGPADAAALRTYITTYAGHPAQLTVDGKVFASTFGMPHPDRPVPGHTLTHAQRASHARSARAPSPTAGARSSRSTLR